MRGERRGETYKVLGSENRDNPVTYAESEEDSQISPAILEFDGKRYEEFVADGVLAIFARSCGEGIDDVSSGEADELSCPLLTGLTHRRDEGDELSSVADDWELVEFRRHHSGDESGDWVERIHLFVRCGKEVVSKSIRREAIARESIEKRKRECEVQKRKD